jgi:subtilisin family serine protease
VDFTGLTGRGVRVAIIDSGVNPAHPHVGGIAGGVEITASGESDVYLDYLGHGTAVAGAIREKAPEALLYAVKVFDRALSTSIDKILRAIEWSVAQRVDIVNLSLGTANPAHREALEGVVARALEAGVALVAAQDSLPGCLDGVLAVGLDWECPRDTYRSVLNGARPCFFASGYPRAIPGVPQERNLNGISFAVANMSGFAARARQMCGNGPPAALERALVDRVQI